MLNSKCNLNCSYCFAQESMNAVADEISESAFKQAVDFGLSNKGSTGLGIIGGEPTLHSKFDYLIYDLINDKRIKTIDVFTNGTTLDRHLSTLSNNKVYILVNCNPISITGKELQKKTLRGLDLLFESGVSVSRIGLGFNLHSQKEDLDYYLYLIDRYHMDTVRLSVSVPNSFETCGTGRFNFFKQHLSQTQSFVRELLDRGVTPIFDCNKLPSCLLINEFEELRHRYENNTSSWNALLRSNYLNGYSRCTPSIVVDGNLNAIRCFALSKISRVSIRDYNNLKELQDYYQNTIDCKGYVSDHPDCTNCKKLINKQCMGGCLIFKV